MREASNCNEVVKKVKKETNIDINIIDGKKEAEIIFSTDLNDLIESDQSYLYVDVGGGSTEITLLSKGEIINSKSFNLGTVRLLRKEEETTVIWEEMEYWIKSNTKNINSVSLIGSGGNINKIFKLSGRKLSKPLTYKYIRERYKFLKQLSYNDRVREIGLNPDRADVIVPATRIYLNAMKWGKAKKIYVPKIGLADGIVKSLHQKLL